MQGVEILEIIYEYGYLLPIWWIAVCAVSALIICILGMAFAKMCKVQKVLDFLFIIFICGMIVCAALNCVQTNEIVDTTYKVSISDDISMNDFYKNYDVIEHNGGNVFTVREKKICRIMEHKLLKADEI